MSANQIKRSFLVRGENRSTRRKTSQSRVEHQQIQPKYDGGSGDQKIEPGRVLSPLPQLCYDFLKANHQSLRVQVKPLQESLTNPVLNTELKSMTM